MNPEALALWKYFGSQIILTTGRTISHDFPQVLRDYDANNVMIYIGIAPRGALTSDAVWTIWNLGYTGNNLTSEKTAPINSIWDNRVGLVYS